MGHLFACPRAAQGDVGEHGLDARLDQLATLVRLLLKADAALAQQGARVTEGLARLSECQDLRYLLTEVPTAPRPESRAELDALDRKLAEARVLRQVITF